MRKKHNQPPPRGVFWIMLTVENFRAFCPTNHKDPYKEIYDTLPLPAVIAKDWHLFLYILKCIGTKDLTPKGVFTA